MTGYVSYATGQAGYISELQVDIERQTVYWHGLYGLAWRVPGYTDQLLETLYAGQLSSSGLFL